MCRFVQGGKDGDPVLGLEPGRRIALRRAAGEESLPGIDPTVCEWFAVAKPVKTQLFGILRTATELFPCPQVGYN